MAADTPPDTVQATGNKSKKHKKKKSKAVKDAANGENETTETNGLEEHVVEGDDEAAEGEESTTDQPNQSATTNLKSNGDKTEEVEIESTVTESISEVNGRAPASGAVVEGDHKDNATASATATSDTAQRLEAAVKERDELRAEVIELRKSLEDISQRHEEEGTNLRSELETTRNSKEHAETRYQRLLGQVNTIKAQLGERLKADAAELAQARSQIEELEDQNRAAKESNEALQSDLSKITSESQQQAQELSSLRGRTNLSQQNWAKERDDLVMREAQVREEFEAAKQAMQDWEVLAMEERSVREGLSDRVAELEEQIMSQREALDRAVGERDTQSLTVDGLQRALQEIQEARKQELREIVEKSHVQLEELSRKVKIAEEASGNYQNELETTRENLDRALPFEKEVKEKNLLIGKLRHEAVILNDHLTKALKFLKKGKPEDNVDRQLVTNHFLHFVQLDRADPKKFQVLQLIAALLHWTDEQRESAGLMRPGAASSSDTLRMPLSPFRRVSSSASLNHSLAFNNAFASPSLNQSEFPLGSPQSKETLAELWSDFLERESQDGGGKSRAPSAPGTPTGMKSPNFTGLPRIPALVETDEDMNLKPVV